MRWPEIVLLLSTTVEAAEYALPGIALAPWEKRQAASSSSVPYSTLGYSSASSDSSGIIWAPFSYPIDDIYTTRTDDWFELCSVPWSYTYLSSGSRGSYSTYTVSSSCPVYTTCSRGTLLGNQASSECVGAGYNCKTWLLFSSYGETDALTNIYCGISADASSSSISTAISLFVERPPATVGPVTSTSATSNAESVNPANIASTSTAPATATSTPPPSGGRSNNNAGIIAGATVGGIAVLGAIGVAVLFILKRSKRQGLGNVPPAQYAMYQQEKGPDPAMVPEWNPHASAVYSSGTGSPHTHSPAPVYPVGFDRGELSGIRSPPVGYMPMTPENHQVHA